jgi:hypothetical protein
MTPTYSDDPSILLGPKPQFESMRSFQNLVRMTPGTPDYEKGRIDYLLERLGKSPYNFVRNGSYYSGARAVMHLKWKYTRFHKEAPTAEKFIDRIAVGSRATGERYLIKVSESRFCPAQKVLHRELELLNQALGQHQETMKRTWQETKDLRSEGRISSDASRGFSPHQGAKARIPRTP